MQSLNFEGRSWPPSHVSVSKCVKEQTIATPRPVGTSLHRLTRVQPWRRESNTCVGSRLVACCTCTPQYIARIPTTSKCLIRLRLDPRSARRDEVLGAAQLSTSRRTSKIGMYTALRVSCTVSLRQLSGDRRHCHRFRLNLKSRTHRRFELKMLMFHAHRGFEHVRHAAPVSVLFCRRSAVVFVFRRSCSHRIHGYVGHSHVPCLARPAITT
jgi:hypothetical protein